MHIIINVVAMFMEVSMTKKMNLIIKPCYIKKLITWQRKNLDWAKICNV